MRSVLRRVVFGAVLGLAAATRAPASAQEIDSITFHEAGIFSGQTIGKAPSPRTATGQINIVSERTLVETTDRICARLGVMFGVRYVLEGRPAGANVMLELVTRFPEPGMVNAKGQRFKQNEFPSTGVVGEMGTRTFGFDEPWEMVPGTWVFEFYFKGRKIGEKSFYVMSTCEVS